MVKWQFQCDPGHADWQFLHTTPGLEMRLRGRSSILFGNQARGTMSAIAALIGKEVDPLAPSYGNALAGSCAMLHPPLSVANDGLKQYPLFSRSAGNGKTSQMLSADIDPFRPFRDQNSLASSRPSANRRLETNYYH
ncbi:hypothetical protein HHL08_22670 [Sphingobium sp. AR-3-1]|uniref:Uncharacterized protein n=1 Tax=Sphingobium psychrophilum TaxID=2728834 RepID=A0A7X9WZP7_9SPHN|nr:hypothetical protein [Sphingobium psychrophilum]NML12900.1 hypothetical protein [Sphingobium psychrophilum]